MSVVSKEFCPITCNVREAVTFFPFPQTQFGYSSSGTAETVSCLTSFALRLPPSSRRRGKKVLFCTACPGELATAFWKLGEGGEHVAQEHSQAETLAPGSNCNSRQAHLGLWNLVSFLMGIERRVALHWGRG